MKNEEKKVLFAVIALLYACSIVIPGVWAITANRGNFITPFGGFWGFVDWLLKVNLLYNIGLLFAYFDDFEKDGKTIERLTKESSDKSSHISELCKELNEKHNEIEKLNERIEKLS